MSAVEYICIETSLANITTQYCTFAFVSLFFVKLWSSRRANFRREHDVAVWKFDGMFHGAMLSSSSSHISQHTPSKIISLKAYFALPDWFDDWDNIPAEKHDDPPDIKAFKVCIL